MLFVIGLILMVFAGSRSWPWWLPIALFAAVSPLFVYQVVVENEWRQTHLSEGELTPIELAGNLLLSLGALLGSYWIGRLIARITGYWNDPRPND